MKERPILFSGPMVRALLAGTKTQTRRVLKVPHENPLGKWEVLPWGGPNGGRTRDGKTVPYQNVIGHTRTGEIIACPYGEPGDRLWVRETFYCDHCFYPEGTPPSCYWDGDKPRAAHTPEQIQQERADMLDAMYYRADGDPEFEAPEGPTPWRPSIHMPRWASRITLEITSVRVERLQDISEADARAEGVRQLRDESGCWAGREGPGNLITPWPTGLEAFRDLWESINGTDSWAANPWVWAVSFRRLP